MRRLTSRRVIAQELPPIGSLVVTRDGQTGRVDRHEDGKALLQFKGHVQGLFSPDEFTVTAEVKSADKPGSHQSKWHTEGAEFHFAADDYPELGEIVNAPRPLVTEPADGTRVSVWSSKKTADIGPDGNRLTHEGPWNRAKNVEPDAYMAGRNAANEHSLSLSDEEKVREAERHNGAFWSGSGPTAERAYHAGQADSYAEKAMGTGGRSQVSFGIGTHTFQPSELGKTSSRKTADFAPGAYTKLVMALTEYDRKQEGKPGYNRYALPQYLGAAQRAQELVNSGETVRNALIKCFSGRLLSVALKAVGEPKGTDDEIRWGRTSSKTADGLRDRHDDYGSDWDDIDWNNYASGFDQAKRGEPLEPGHDQPFKDGWHDGDLVANSSKTADNQWPITSTEGTCKFCGQHCTPKDVWEDGRWSPAYGDETGYNCPAPGRDKFDGNLGHSIASRKTADHTDTICAGSGKVDDGGYRCPVCDQVTDGWHTIDGFVRKWHSDPSGQKESTRRRPKAPGVK